MCICAYIENTSDLSKHYIDSTLSVFSTKAMIYDAGGTKILKLMNYKA